MDSIYTFTVPLYIKTLGGLRGVLLKAKDHVKETNANEEAFLQARLAPDMFPLIKQVQMACDNAKNSTARLAGVPIPAYTDTEKTIDELVARIDATVAFVQSVPEASFADAGERHVTLPYFPGKHFRGFDYAREWGIPNFYFHVTIAYALIRHQDVEIGKGDYLNGYTLLDGE